MQHILYDTMPWKPPKHLAPKACTNTSSHAPTQIALRYTSMFREIRASRIVFSVLVRANDERKMVGKVKTGESCDL